MMAWAGCLFILVLASLLGFCGIAWFTCCGTLRVRRVSGVWVNMGYLVVLLSHLSFQAGTDGAQYGYGLLWSSYPQFGDPL